MWKLQVNEILPFVDHSGNQPHVDFHVVNVELIQELFEEVFKVADAAFVYLLTVQTLISKVYLRCVEHKRAFIIIK